MHLLEKSLDHFLQSLHQRKAINLEENGSWSMEPSYLKSIKRWLGFDEKRQLATVQAFISALDRLEKFPISFSDSGVPVKQKIDFKLYLSIGEEFFRLLEESVSEERLELEENLSRRLIALKYRLEMRNGGIDTVVSDVHGLDKLSFHSSLLPDLLHVAAQWKERQKGRLERSLSIQDIEVIHEIGTYGEFAGLLLRSDNLQEKFFEWTLRDKNPVGVFIQFPALQENLTASLLQTRIGRLGGHALAIAKVPIEGENEQQKIVTLLVEGKPVSILDEEKLILFKGNYALKLKEIFNIFRNKENDVGNLEFFHEGIINWNTHRFGSWNADLKKYERVDLNQSKWWEQLPLFERLTEEESYFRYGVPLDGEHWLVAAAATRTSLNLDFENTHAFLEIAIPSAAGGYQIFHFGKFGIHLLPTFYEQLSHFCKTVPAVIAYPDSNVFYSHRQLNRYPFLIVKENGMRLMEAIKTDIIRGHQGNFVYQVESENCAKWSYETLVAVLGQDRVPNLYRMPLLETHPTGLVAKIFKFVKRLPSMLQVRVLTGLHMVLGAWRGTWIIENGQRVWKSLVSHEFWQTTEVYLPALLVEQSLNGALTLHSTKVDFAPWQRSVKNESSSIKNLDFDSYYVGHRDSISLHLGQDHLEQNDRMNKASNQDVKTLVHQLMNDWQQYEAIKYEQHTHLANQFASPYFVKTRPKDKEESAKWQMQNEIKAA